MQLVRCGLTLGGFEAAPDALSEPRWNRRELTVSHTHTHKRFRHNTGWRAEGEGGSVSDNTRVCLARLGQRFQTSIVFPPLFTAGNCWLQQGKNGRCQVLYMSGMSREECCRGGRLGTSWTEEDVPNSTLFRWMIFNGGAPNCIPCKGGGALIFLSFPHYRQCTSLKSH